MTPPAILISSPGGYWLSGDFVVCGCLSVTPFLGLQENVVQNSSMAVVWRLDRRSTQKWFQEDWQQQNAVIFVVMDPLTQGNGEIIGDQRRF